MVSMDDDDDVEPEMSPEEAAALLRMRVSVEFIGGPNDGTWDESCKIFAPPFDRVFFINRTLCHFYTLKGNVDDGFQFHYDGVKRYKCTGDGTYEVDLKEIK